jgi:serine/threonine protein kinase/TRAP-type mannitol/chloroaromatic compound transport system substrate-binding protein
MFCPQCRTNLPDDAQYCINCGHDLTRLKTHSMRTPSDSLDGENISTYLKTDDPLDSSDTALGIEGDKSHFARGTLFASRYEILTDGKKGGMGAVYRVKDTKLGRFKALKVIHPSLVSHPQAIERFRQEVAICQELQHPHVVRVYDLEERDGIEYFTMEWVDGMSLRDILNERKLNNKPFRLEEVYAIISQLCDALYYAHKFTVHRDVKPENILIEQTNPDKTSTLSDSSFTLKLTDFGIAKMLSPSQFMSTSLAMGTPYYMAPEQKLDAGHIDHRADIYAVGVILFELLTMENTVGLEMPSEINPSLPKEIDAIVKKALATKPEQRYQDTKALNDVLLKIVSGDQKKDEEEKQRRENEVRKKREVEEARLREEKRQAEEQRHREEEEKERRRSAEESARQEQERQIEPKNALKEGEVRIKEAKRNGLPILAFVVIGLVLIAGVVILISMNSRNVQSPAATGETQLTQPSPKSEAGVPAPAPTPLTRPEPTVSSAPMVQLRFATLFPSTHSLAAVTAAWCQEVERRTNGKVKVSHSPGGALIPGPQTYEGVVRGTIDVGETALSYTMGKFPLSEVFDYPLGYPNATIATRLANAYYTKFTPREFNEVKVMFFHASGPGILHTRSKPVQRLEDLVGMKIRTFGGTGRFIQLLGGAPVAFPMGEAYDLINKGAADGILGNGEVLKSWKIGEVVKYTTQNYGSANSQMFVVAMNKDKWNSMSSDQQKVIEQINQEWIEKASDAWNQMDREGYDFAQKRGVKVIRLSAEEDVRWAAKAQPLFDEYVNKTRERSLPGNEVLQFARDFISKNSK